MELLMEFSTSKRRVKLTAIKYKNTGTRFSKYRYIDFLCIFLYVFGYKIQLYCEKIKPSKLQSG